jgi:hypothetical protein
MRKLGLYFIILGFITACGPKVDLPEGSPPLLQTAKLIDLAKDNGLIFSSLKINGRGKFSGQGLNQSFKYELRVAHDSLIWIDIADPILGLKIARGLITKNEVAFFNRLNRKYQKGSSEEMAQKLGFNFDFEPLMSILSASFLNWEQSWRQDYRPHSYFLVNYPISAGQLPPPPGVPLMEQELESKSFRPQSFKFDRPTQGQKLEVQLLEYQDFDAVQYPRKMLFNYKGKAPITIELEVSDLSLNEVLSFPFRIPSSYEQG